MRSRNVATSLVNVNLRELHSEGAKHRVKKRISIRVGFERMQEEF
jgi:hypothetical protein